LKAVEAQVVTEAPALCETGRRGSRRTPVWAEAVGVMESGWWMVVGVPHGWTVGGKD